MDKWINVNDELPMQYASVIVAFSFELPLKYAMPFHKGKKKMGVTTGYMDKYNMFQLNKNMSTYRNVEVMYWMPMPNPPE